MKIFGYFDPLGFARIKAKVICKNLPQRDIRFLVDTGAYRTTIVNYHPLNGGGVTSDLGTE